MKSKTVCLGMMTLVIALTIGSAIPHSSHAMTFTTDSDDKNERVTVECKKVSDGKALTKRDLINKTLADKYCLEHEDDQDCPVGGCDPGANAAGTSATGFYGIGGTNPVPASPARTCKSGKLCANPGQANCSALNSSWTCKHTYNYSTEACGCGCKP